MLVQTVPIIFKFLIYAVIQVFKIKSMTIIMKYVFEFFLSRWHEKRLTIKRKD